MTSRLFSHYYKSVRSFITIFKASSSQLSPSSSKEKGNPAEFREECAFFRAVVYYTAASVPAPVQFDVKR